MSMTATGSSKEPQAEINVTPLIDVLLVLLIIFMVIQPSTVQGLDALIPHPPKTPTQPESNPEAIVVQVLTGADHNITYKINETSLTRLEIEPKLAQIFADRTDKVMFIKGDAGLDFSLVADVINDGHRAGVDNIGIITQHPNHQQ